MTYFITGKVKGILILVLILMAYAKTCIAQVDDEKRARQIIEKTILTHGGKAYNDFHIGFTFRGKDFEVRNDNGRFAFKKTFTDSTGKYEDRLTNDAFVRYLNGQKVALSDKEKSRWSNSVNSVVYFTMLPKGLADPAVNALLTDTIDIKGRSYFQIVVTFDQEGGGDDFEDVFIYWIAVDTYHMEYFAYQYHVNGGGTRFREAIDPVVVGGIRFQNYVNYKPESKTAALEKLPALFEQGALKKLSEIINENVREL